MPQKKRKIDQDGKPEPQDQDLNMAVNSEQLTPIVVGIGASAGGLAAIEAFFRAMPAADELNIAFILVQHLAPDYKSNLASIIKHYTNMPVFEIEDGTAVKKGCVYVTPSNHALAILNGTLQLLDRIEKQGPNLPIDSFFKSLANDQRGRAVGIILSGTGSDGTEGIRAIKANGGLVIAQLPESAKYEGMPLNAIATNLVDYVLAPAEMPARLTSYVGFSLRQTPRAAETLELAPSDDALQKILVLLRDHSGHNFSQYKPSTIARRIERRMNVQQIADIDQYIQFLQDTPAEIGALFQDLLIGVTSFFRDPEAFAALESVAIPHIFDHKAPGSTIRIWVPGCATGEEAYSIAILLQEKIETLKQNYKVQLFATDIDTQAIEQARTGIYSAAIAENVSPERLERFFIQDPDQATYQIQKQIREMIIFSEQNVIQDPPLSRLDMISCRNLLIYMNVEAQRRLIPLFHYALAPEGLLFLGNSETVGEFVTFFEVLDRKWKLYRRHADSFDNIHSGLGEFLPFFTTFDSKRRGTRSGSSIRTSSYRAITEHALLDAYVPGSLLVNAAGEILYIHGRTGHFLEPAPGEPGMNILTMAREGLRRTLTIALQSAATQKKPVFFSGLKVRSNGDYIQANLSVRPLVRQVPEQDMQLIFLVTVEEVGVLADVQDTAVEADVELDLTSAGAAHIAELERELRAREENLHSTREEMSTTNEELKSANEELQSVNEELQSTNEELETSKEELQSVNEELATVNAELREKVTELVQANTDMSNLLSATGIGTIFVDHHLKIMRFTPAATELINLIQADIGWPLSHIVSNLVNYDDMVKDVRAVLDTLVMKEKEVQNNVGRWYLLSIRPYRTPENVIEGVVITFVDITRTKKAESMSRLASFIADSMDAMIVQDLNGNIIAWNPTATELYGWTEKEARQLNVRDRLPPEIQQREVDNIARLVEAKKLVSERTQRLTKDGRVLDVWLIATPLINDDGKMYAVTTTERLAPEKSDNNEASHQNYRGEK